MKPNINKKIINIIIAEIFIGNKKSKIKVNAEIEIEDK